MRWTTTRRWISSFALPARSGAWPITIRASSLVGSTNDLAADTPRSRVDQILQRVPRILLSKPHVVMLMGLGIYLIVLPVLGISERQRRADRR